MAAQDFKLTDGQDIDIANGDFSIVESDQDHIVVILKTYLGSFKQFPLVGLGIDYFLASSTSQQVLRRAMTVQLKGDGYQTNKITLRGENTFYVDANRIKP